MKNPMEVRQIMALSETQLKQISLRAEQLKQLKKALDELLDVMTQNESLFSKLANRWGTLPQWQKVLIGIILIVPMLIAAIATHLIALLTLSLCLLVTYTTSSLLLDDHHQQCKKDEDHLKKGLSGFTTCFETVINFLDELGEQLALTVEQLHQENTRLSERVNNLGEEIILLTQQTEALPGIKQQLQETQKNLEQTTATISEQTDLIVQYNAQFKQLVQEADLTQSELTAQNAHLNQIRIQLESELKKTQQIADILQGTVQTLSSEIIQDKDKRGDFQHRLEEFLAHKELTLDHFALSLLEKEQKLRLLQEEFTCLNERHAVLLDQQDIQIKKLEQEVGNYQVKAAHALTNMGMFFKPACAEERNPHPPHYFRAYIGHIV